MPIAEAFNLAESAFGTLGGMFITNLLPQHHNPLFENEKFLEVSGDRLIIAIESSDSSFDPVTTRKFLEKIGGSDIEEVSA